MYAVVSTGGKQLKVEEGTEAVVEKLDAPVGDTVTLDVLFVADDGRIVSDSDALAKASVSAEVVEHFLGDKQIVFKFKRRKGYKRLKGHRQQQTRIRVTGIAADEAKKAAKSAAKKPKKAEKVEAKVEEAEAKVEEVAKKAEAKVEKVAKKAEAKVEEVAKKAEQKTKAAAEKVEAKVEETAAKAKEKVEKPKAEKKAAEKPKAAKAKADAKPALCAAKKADGTPCKNKAKEGSEYCGVHAKKYDK